MAVLDFPASPVVGQNYTSPIGTVYTFDGQGWVVGFYDSQTQAFTVLGDILEQIRTLLQDVDTLGGQYRYSSDSIVQSINLGMIEMFRVRPDIFLETKFVVPQFSVSVLTAPWPIEQQWVPAIVFYAVGETQLRDDEGTQDTRAAAFLQKFTAVLVPAP
jgi:hypothetical protein